MSCAACSETSRLRRTDARLCRRPTQPVDAVQANCQLGIKMRAEERSSRYVESNPLRRTTPPLGKQRPPLVEGKWS